MPRRKPKYGYDDHGKPIRSDRDDDFDDLDEVGDGEGDDSFTWEDMEEEEFAADDELDTDDLDGDDDSLEWSDLNPDTPDEDEDFTP